jgi:hypothetical protein
VQINNDVSRFMFHGFAIKDSEVMRKIFNDMAQW